MVKITSFFTGTVAFGRGFITYMGRLPPIVAQILRSLVSMTLRLDFADFYDLRLLILPIFADFYDSHHPVKGETIGSMLPMYDS